MIRKFITFFVIATALLLGSGCRRKTQNPLANIESKQPDKGLFDRAMDSLKHGRFQEARTLLDTLINAYPDSEYIARAKLAKGDAWYQEGGTAAWQEAEVEYKDFITFFPNLPEAAEAQLKVANIHYRSMEKPDRDFAQATRAAEEYRTLIQQFPDSSLVPQAKQRLREVQEVLAERQYRIAHFYGLRENLAAAEARLISLVNSYPLYSQADEALYELGGIYEREALGFRKAKLPAAEKEKIVAELEKKAVDAYTRVVTRYPEMERVGDAKRRLQALNAPVPTPTAEAIAENKSEEQSRGDIGMIGRVTGNFKRHPNVARATKVGEPELKDEDVTSAPAIVQELNQKMRGQSQPDLSVQPIVGTGDPGKNQAPPSDTDANKAEGTAPAAAPAQVNEVQKDSAQQQDEKTDQNNGAKQDSTSKKKGKKGLRKLIPF